MDRSARPGSYTKHHERRGTPTCTWSAGPRAVWRQRQPRQEAGPRAAQRSRALLGSLVPIPRRESTGGP
jgi:hypothetical protein